MSIVQGTIVRMTAMFRRRDDNQPFDPVNVVVLVDHDFVDEPAEYRYDAGAGQVTRLGTGAYRLMIDTSPAYGLWIVQVEGEGDIARIGRRVFVVKKAA